MSKSSNDRSILGVTTGDPKGIGPEVVARALEDPEVSTLADFRVFGALSSNPKLDDREAGRLALQALEEATLAALRGEVGGLVTGPVHKARLRFWLKNFVGHTEFFAERCRCEVLSLFVARQWRVALVTRHLPLAEVPAKLNAVDILRTIRQTAAALRRYFHLLDPSLAVCGLNPHAGEAGHFGKEERQIIGPAIEQARKEAIRVEGPFSPDTLFWQMTQGRFDAVVAMYHDQGLIPLKTLAFKECVQLTLGLPFLRLSVDHGTADDLAGTGRADPANMKAALRLACQLVIPRSQAPRRTIPSIGG